MRLLLEVDIDQHMSNVIIVVVEGISHRNQGDRRKRPSKCSSANETIRSFKCLLVLGVAHFWGENIWVSPKNTQKGHEMLFGFFTLVLHQSGQVNIL